MSLSKQIISWSKAAALPDTASRLKVAIVFQDAPTCSWAAEICEQLLAANPVHSTACKLSDLSRSVPFADAVLDALLADVIVVSIHAAADLPEELCVWLEAWLPLRSRKAGMLVALLGVPESAPPPSSPQAQQHLRVVARRAGLEFLLEQRRLPAAPPPLSRKLDCRPKLCHSAPAQS